MVIMDFQTTPKTNKKTKNKNHKFYTLRHTNNYLFMMALNNLIYENIINRIQVLHVHSLPTTENKFWLDNNTYKMYINSQK